MQPFGAGGETPRGVNTFLAFEVGQIYWENAKANYGAEFVEAIDVDLSSFDLNLTARQYRGMLADIRRLGQDDHRVRVIAFQVITISRQSGLSFLQSDALLSPPPKRVITSKRGDPR